MDLYCTAHKAVPFVDGKCYPKICFGCFWVPKTEEQIYDDKGLLVETKNIKYSPKKLHTAEEIYNQGSCESMKEARACVKGVRAACKKPGKLSLDGRPKDPQVGITYD